MKIFILFSLFLNTSISFSKEEFKVYKIYKKGVFEPIKIFEINKKLINEKCFQNQKSCIALNLKKSQLKIDPNKLLGHPAAKKCKSLNGKYKILHFNHQRTGFCRFKDGTMINAWSIK